MKIEELATPCYIIRKNEYESSIKNLMQAYESRWHGKVIYGYSIKTNHLPYLMNIAREYGWWAEAVSPAEYHHSIRQGFHAENIIYNGPQKGNNLLEVCKAGGIINIDNLKEITMLSQINKKEIKAKIGIRINFDLEKYCPGETTVGSEIGRFGLSHENGDVLKAINMLREKGIKISGLHMHSSTSSRSLKVYETLSQKAIELAKLYKLEDIDYIDMGGGYFGGNFFKGKPTVDEYADTITEILREYFDSSRVSLILEPGAAVLATAADYLTSVINIRDIREKQIVTVDGTCLHVNSFMKSKQQTPCTVLNAGIKAPSGSQIIGGSTCMEMDRLYPKDIDCILTEESKLLFHCAGAYTMTHNSSFINLMPNIYVEDNHIYEPIRISEPYMMEI